MKPRKRRLKKTALALIAVGVLLFALSVYMEALNYPWERLLGVASQSADSIPDPPPIVLDQEDAAAAVTVVDYSAAGAVPAPPTETAPPSADESAPAESAQPSANPVAVLPGDETAEKKAPVQYVVLGVLKIPVLGVSQNILEGAGKQMKYGVGHLPSTAAIGQKGNCAISGHRTFPFRYLDMLKAGDSVILKSGDNRYTYTVYESFTVLPEEVWVLNSVEGKDYILTLITCTPYMVSSHRLIVRAELIDINGIAPHAFYGEQEPEPEAPASDSGISVSGTPAASGESPETVPAESSEDISETPAPPQDAPPYSVEAGVSDTG